MLFPTADLPFSTTHPIIIIIIKFLFTTATFIHNVSQQSERIMTILITRWDIILDFPLSSYELRPWRAEKPLTKEKLSLLFERHKRPSECLID